MITLEFIYLFSDILPSPFGDDSSDSPLPWGSVSTASMLCLTVS